MTYSAEAASGNTVDVDFSQTTNGHEQGSRNGGNRCAAE